MSTGCNSGPRSSKTPPTSREGIEKYLGSGMIKGIGPVYAKKMVDKFGEEVLTVIEKSSAQLEEIGGIGTWQSHRFLAEQSDWLRDHIAIAGGVRSV